MPHVTVDGLRIHFEDTGSGVPVVVLHGMGSSFASWQERGWQDALMAAGFRVVGIDARGHGQSDAVTDPAQLRNGPCVCDVTAVLAACGVERAHVIGYSMGAGHALRLGLEAPERVLSLTLGGLGGIAMACAGLFVRSALESRVKLAAGAAAVGGLLQQRGERQATYAPLQFEALQQDALEAGTLDALQRPVLVVTGEHDTAQGDFAALAVSEILGAQIPGARRVIIEGANHLSAPAAPAFKQAVLEFLGGLPPLER
jgi:pimeloyl-ACP methyl ester carboxylesterase